MSVQMLTELNTQSIKIIFDQDLPESTQKFACKRIMRYVIVEDKLPTFWT